MRSNIGILGGFLSVLGFVTGGFGGLPVASADQWIEVSPDGEVKAVPADSARAPWVIIGTHSKAGMDCTFNFRHFGLSREQSASGEFTAVRGVSTPSLTEIGEPVLPVVRKIFAVPVGTQVAMKVQEGPAIAVDLEPLGFDRPVWPAQVPAGLDEAALKDAVGRGDAGGLEAYLPSKFQMNRGTYEMDAYGPVEPVVFRELAVARGMQLYVLEARPVAYNPIRQELAARPWMHVELAFTDWQDPAPRPADWLNAVVMNPVPLSVDRDGEAGHLLILTAVDYDGSAPMNEYIAAKIAQGFEVSYWVIPDHTYVFDIQASIQAIYGTPDEPTHILMVGDKIGTSVYSGTNHLPSFVSCVEFCVSDIQYVCLDGPDDWFPDIVIGRIPVRTVEQLEAVVDKVLYYEGGEFADPGYLERAVFLAGGESYAQGIEMNETVISNYMDPRDISSTRIYASEGGDTQDISDAFNAGCFLGSYFGHAGGMEAWGNPYFGYNDIDALLNQYMYPFLVSFSCSSAQFYFTDQPGDPGFLEKWLQVPDKGAATGYGTTRRLDPYTWDTWQNLYQFFYYSVYHDGIRDVGSATLAADAYLVAFYGSDAPVSEDHTHSFIIIGDPTMRVPDPPQDNYLIVTAEAYVGSTALNAFIAHKEGLGFNVMTYVAAPGTTNTAIKNYILSLWGTADSPDYILLVGDTSGQTAGTGTVPHFIGGGDHQGVTDWPYGCMDPWDDWYPDIPVGRFSVTSASMLQDVVDKTIKVETGNFPDPDYVKRGAFLANPSTNGQAEPTHDWVIDNYLTPNEYEGIRIYSAQGGTTQDVTNAVNNGALFCVYFGHSSSSGWWDPAFSSTNVNALSNDGLYGMVFGWSCNTSAYAGTCFGETWLRAPNRGAAAYISASDYIYWGTAEAWRPSVIHEKAIFAAMFEDDIWVVGPAWVRSFYRFLADYGGWDGDPTHLPAENVQVCRNFLEEYVILGDPALRLPRPIGFELVPNVTIREACVPDDTQVGYLIDVTATGGFNGSVHLSLLDPPLPADVSFSANDLSPPFSSMLTVGNLQNVAPGIYQMTLVGTSAEKQQTTPLTLGVSETPPGNTTLTSPANGAVDVPRQPALVWQPASEAAAYEVQVSTDPSFNTIVFSRAVAETSVLIDVNLATATTHWWRVRATNGCGTGAYSTPFSFTVVEEVDYFVEEFGGFDLDYYTMRLIPNGSANYYLGCLEDAQTLPTDPTGGTTLSLSDDGFTVVNVPGGNSVSLYGTPYSSFFVNANGSVTFTAGDGTWTESLAQHFAYPRIAPLFDDLNPAAGGTVSWKDAGDRVAVSWVNVPEYGTSNVNTFQIEMFYDTGEIAITWLRVDAGDGITGLSAGGGIPDDFLESNLSESPVCLEPATGACCNGTVCTELTSLECAQAGGQYQGDNTGCDPNPCVDYDSSCLIISEVVQGKESGDCPRFIELTNTGLDPFPFFEGGVIVQASDGNDVYIDIDLAGVVIGPGQSYVIASNVNGVCTGAFYAIYGQPADFYTEVPFGFGDERFIITDTNDASNIIDIYGEFGCDGTGHVWEFTDGYSYRLPEWIGAMGDHFAPAEWYFGGVGSLEGENPTELLLTLTTPGAHQYVGQCGPHVMGDVDGDMDVDTDDWTDLAYCLTGPDVPYAGGCEGADLDHDGDVDLGDFCWMQEFLVD